MRSRVGAGAGEGEVLPGMWLGAVWPGGMCWSPAIWGQMSRSYSRPGDFWVPLRTGVGQPLSSEPPSPTV